MSFAWSDDLRTGIPDIDRQHKALIEQFNGLIEACRQEKGREEIGKFLAFLTGYVRRHFDDEERAMARNVYEGIEAHMREHEQYRRKLDAMRNELADPGMADKVVSDAVWIAAEWFVSHIKRTDQAMARALRDQWR